MKDLLNQYQWNSLRIRLRSFEEGLRHALEWLDGYEEDGVLYSRKLILSEKNRKQAQQEIRYALDKIAKISRLLDMPKETENPASLVRGEMTVSWADLMDSRARKLGRYGKVHPELSDELDPQIEKLAETARNLSAIFGESQQEKP